MVQLIFIFPDSSFSFQEPICKNSGVMLLNVANLRAVHSQLMQFTKNSSNFRLDMVKKGIKYESGYLDQGALFSFIQNKRDFLPVEYNWRPYMRFNENHFILHFAGPKAHECKRFLLNKTEESSKSPLLSCRKNPEDCMKHVAIYEEWLRRVMSNESGK